MRHEHRFGGRGRAVIHRGVGDLHAGQKRYLGLELEQILQGPLRDLGLIGRVSRHEFGALDQMVDAGRNVMFVSAASGKERHRARRNIAGGKPRHGALDGDLAFVAGQPFECRQQEFRRHGIEQSIDVLGADGREHRLAVLPVMWQITHYSKVSR